MSGRGTTLAHVHPSSKSTIEEDVPVLDTSTTWMAARGLQLTEPRIRIVSRAMFGVYRQATATVGVSQPCFRSAYKNYRSGWWQYSQVQLLADDDCPLKALLRD